MDLLIDVYTEIQHKTRKSRKKGDAIVKKGILAVLMMGSLIMAISAAPSVIVGTWKTYDGEVLTLTEDGQMTFSQEKSINGNPGTITSTGRYSYDAASQKFSYTIEKTRLKNSAGYDDTKGYGQEGRSFVETAVVKGKHLYWANRDYVDDSKMDDNSSSASEGGEIDALLDRLENLKSKMVSGDSNALAEFQDLSPQLMARSENFSDAQLDRFMKIVSP